MFQFDRADLRSFIDQEIAIVNIGSRGTRRLSACALTLFGFVGSSTPSAAQEAEILGLRWLSRFKRNSIAYGVSLDGNTVVGWSLRSGFLNGDAFRWTRDEGMVRLGLSDTTATSCSANGDVIVGVINRGGYSEAFYWTREEGAVAMGDFHGGGFSSGASAVSGDGMWIVGGGTTHRSDPFKESFRWTRDDGFGRLGFLPGARFGSAGSGAGDASSDGGVIVGQAPNANGSFEAFRWTRREGMTALLDESGAIDTYAAYGVSPDGRVVVGMGFSDRSTEGFRWTPDDGLVGLGSFEGERRIQSWAYDVSADGSVIVCNADHGNGGEYWVGGAAVWDATHGMRSLYLLLRDEFGVDMSAWDRLNDAYAVSGDGFTIVGYGEKSNSVATEAYRVQLPCLEFCERCSFAENLSVHCVVDQEGRARVEGVLRDAKPGETVTLCLTDKLYAKNRCKTRTVNAEGRATARWSRPAGDGWQVRMKECNVEAYVECP